MCRHAAKNKKRAQHIAMELFRKYAQARSKGKALVTNGNVVMVATVLITDGVGRGLEGNPGHH
eukprot:1159571-Pelagomonas_calceolata.AAC.7